MDMTEFQDATLETAVYPDKGRRTRAAINYCVVGLCGEAGELANKWKKVLRGDKDDELDGLAKELRDVLWYTVRAMDELGRDMEIEAEELIRWLNDRKARGVVKGSGDNR